jgi:enolase-phosphatase E1
VKIDCDYILTDIEGTTTSISFVQDILFPYFLSHINEIYLLSDMNEVKYIFGKVMRIVKKEENRDITTSEEVIEQLKIWCKEDRKITQLKTLQGILWQKGYQSGELFGHIYDDVPIMLKNWELLGKKMGVFSSGSVIAQKLLFSHSTKGNLSTFFSHYFDTNTGHKRETDTYSLIANEISLSPNRILFLSDVVEELEAAEKAGLQTVQVKREGNVQSWKQAVLDFSEIVLK